MEGSKDKVSTRLFLSNLAPWTKKAKLLQVFSQHHPIRAVVRRDKGVTAFIDFETPQAANDALEAAAKMVIHNRKVRPALADSWNERGKRRRVFTPPPVPEEEQALPGYTPPEGPQLPPEVIARIAGYLTYYERARIEQVSRNWRIGSQMSHQGTKTLVMDDWRWGKTRTAWTTNINAAMMNWTLRRCGRVLRGLDFTGCNTELPSQLITIAAKRCPLLRELTTDPLILTEAALRELGDLNTLVKLSIGNVRGPVNPDLKTILQNNQGLESLRLVHNPLTGKSLTAINQCRHFTLLNCPNVRGEMTAKFIKTQKELEDLEINNCESLKHGLILEAFQDNPNISRTLRRLKMHNSETRLIEYPDEEEIPEEQLGNYIELNNEEVEASKTVSEAIRALSDLELTQCGWVDRTFIESMSRHLTGLTRLNISACTNIRGQFALDSLTTLIQCTHLSMNNMHPSVGGHFLRLMTVLENLECRDNEGVYGEDLCGLMRQVRSVTTIDAEGCMNVGRETVECAYELLRTRNSNAVLRLYLGETAARPYRRDRRNWLLQISYTRTTPRLL